jgi:O-antigen ligase
VIVPMPDISFFIWWEYITHNSIIWVWMKMGVGGFLALIYLVGVTLSTGIYVTNRMPVGDMRSIALAATLYVLMHFIYAYVDMSWDSRSMVYIGAMMALLNIMEHVVVKQTPLKRKRWPWQPELAAETAILPTP